MILDQEFRVESRSSEFRVRVQEFRVQEFRVAMQVPGIQGSESRSSMHTKRKKQCTQNGNKTMHKKR